MHNKNYLGEYILFFIWPIASFFRALKRHKRPWAKNIIWLFVAFYGYTFLATNEGFDSFDYMRDLIQMHQQQTELRAIFSSLYTLGGEKDIYDSIIIFLVSRFTEDSRILFLVVALVFGYFF